MSYNSPSIRVPGGLPSTVPVSGRSMSTSACGGTCCRFTTSWRRGLA
jgi:hypothetical protein